MKVFTNIELKHLSIAFRNSHGKELKLQAKRKYVKKLVDEFGLLGSGGEVVIPLEQKLQIKRKLEQLYSLDNLLDTEAIRTLNRIEQARKFQNEKFDSTAPNKNFILTKGKIPLKVGHFTVPFGASIRVNLRDLALNEIREVLVVENLAAFDSLIEGYNCLIDGTLVVYRGHGIDARAVQNLLNLAHEFNFDVSVWADFDPAGIVIAFNTINVNNVLFPDLDNVDMGKVSQPELFLKQYKYLNGVKALANQFELIEIKKMLSQKLAITQEHQIAHCLTLKKININHKSKVEKK